MQVARRQKETSRKGLKPHTYIHSYQNKNKNNQSSNALECSHNTKPKRQAKAEREEGTRHPLNTIQKNPFATQGRPEPTVPQPLQIANPNAHRLLAPLRTRLPTSPAATAKPPTIAMPMRPSLATLSSMRDPRLAACKLAGSFSSNRSLYRRASP